MHDEALTGITTRWPPLATVVGSVPAFAQATASRFEVRRRNWSMEDRLRIARETLEPAVVVQAVAKRHGVRTGQLYTWREQMLATTMAGFIWAIGRELKPVEPPPARSADISWARVGRGNDKGTPVGCFVAGRIDASSKIGIVPDA